MELLNMQPNGPKVSVLIPAYNAERYLGDALDSITGQSFEDFEVIVVNDGSSDKTGEVADSHARKDKRIRVIHQKNQGVSAATNVAARLASAPLLAKLDADDMAESDRLEKQFDFMDRNPQAVCCGSAISYIDDRGRKSGGRKFPLSNDVIQGRILSYGCFAHSAVVYRRSAFFDAGMYRREFKSCVDFDLLLRLSEQGEMANLPEALCLYRLHHDQLTHQPSSNHRYNGLLAAASAVKRRRGAPEILPQAGSNAELAIAVIQEWCDGCEMEWTWHIASALKGLKFDLHQKIHRQICGKVVRKLVKNGDFLGAIQTAEVLWHR
jgi:glycosyltransferase involved in cell wall biosynthesis